ncbi:MAG TPA: DUF4230 domain-containing protein [Gemmatimonadaceae bacterium]|nr:DUF4230 domain-containing protein [Gemmatimonadaceae bacterium]
MTQPLPPAAPPPPPAPGAVSGRGRHLLPIGAAALLLFFALTLLGFCRPSLLGVPTLADRAGKTTVTHDLVVERVRSVAKLLTSETTVRDVVVYENTWMNSTKRSLVVVTGRVLAGVDLDKGADVTIDDRAKKISVVLPPAEVMAVEVTNLKTYDERAGLWNPFRPEDRDAIQRQVRAQLQRAGTELGVVEHANRSAKTLLETLLATDGYTVDVQTRGVVVPAPARE